MNALNTVCILLSNNKDSKLAADVLIKFGMASKIANDFNEAYNILKSNNFDILFIDFDFSNQASQEFITKLNNDKILTNISLIGTANNVDENLIKSLMSYKLLGFIIKPLLANKIQQQLTIIMNKHHKSYQEKRKHVRIIPPAEDMIRASITLKNKKRITAKVIDLSLGGIALELYNNYNSEELKQGKLIEHLIFSTLTKEIDVDVLILDIKEKVLAMKFTHFYNNSYANLSRYIMKNISF